MPDKWRVTDNELDKARILYEEIAVPEILDDYIMRGIQKAQNRRKRMYRQVWSVVASIVLITLFVTSVRVSTAFAAFVGTIPGLSEIVKLIQYDRGLESAVNNDFMQTIGKSVERDGVKVTVDGIIMDEVRMNVFYSVEISKQTDLHLPSKYDISFENSNHPDLEYSISTQQPLFEGKTNLTKMHAVIDVQFAEQSGIYPDKAIFLIHYSENRAPLDIPFDIDVDKFKGLKEAYTLNQTIEIEGQKFTFTQATIYPTRIVLSLVPDPSNTMKLFSFRNLKIVNEKGEVLNNPLTSGPGPNEEFIFYFESNYFDKPGHLYIEGSAVSALDRSQLNLVIDPVKGEIVTKPDDHIAIESIERNPITLAINLKLSDMDPSDGMAYGIVDGDFHDESSKTYSVGSSRIYTGMGSDTFTTEFTIPNQPYDGLLTFTIYNYPSFIKKPFRVQIK